jgi:hypothetical protein
MLLGHEIEDWFRKIPPAAAATPGSRAAAATFATLIPSARVSIMVSVFPAPLTHLLLGWPLQISPPGPGSISSVPFGSVAGCCHRPPVTVTVVACPYSVLSTLSCARAIPAEAAATVTTSPTPRARPSATKMAWRIRRRNSRRT